ncbi:ABC transporter permease subunit [Alsobacter sp. KACC 23698]|uniref:ABC transporter permease subunit n=1 Tax=Alsobacter sp. KACC 23698 TaxID=3149229 RepID=A0AAU7JNR9_9HYPH
MLAAVVWRLGSNLADNLDARHMTFSFAFLRDRANFDIPFRIVDWKVGDPYSRALLVCTANTLLVSALGVVAATLIGLAVGVMRLSPNWLVRNTALVYVEVVRNTPQLVQVAFWYIGVLQAMPPLRQSITLPGGALLNIRGLYLPTLHWAPWAEQLWWLAAAMVAVTPFAWRYRRRDRPLGVWALLLPTAAVVGLMAGVTQVEAPALRGFNIAGGVQIPPELVALWAGLSMYSSAFIAEIVRGAIVAVAKGQREAALSLGLKPWQILAKVILPQALRIMVPPLTSQYLNLIKSSSLGAAIAYPELFSIFAGTVLNQTGRELETILILMVIFLSISLSTSAFMNWYNRRVSLVMR